MNHRILHAHAELSVPTVSGKWGGQSQGNGMPTKFILLVTAACILAAAWFLRAGHYSAPSNSAQMTDGQEKKLQNIIRILRDYGR
jgi:hypothetical protein